MVTYGPHVSRYVKDHGARNVFEAPQAVDNAFWSAPPTADERRAPIQVLFVGRPDKQKGLATLLAAWNTARPSDGVLVLAGPDMGRYTRSDLVPVGVLDPPSLRNFYAAADVLCVPSVPTRTVRETWGLAVNEAMNQRTPILATDAVGAAAGGLVRDGETGLVVPAGDRDVLASALRRLTSNAALRAQLGEAGSRRGGRAYVRRLGERLLRARLQRLGASASDRETER